MSIRSKARLNNPIKIRERRQKWILWTHNLKVGDEVVVRFRQQLEVVQHIDVVENVTRSRYSDRTIVYVNGNAYRFDSFERLPGFGADAKTIWTSDSRFYEIGQRERARNNALRLLYDPGNRFLSDEELMRIVEVLASSKTATNKSLAARTLEELAFALDHDDCDVDRIVERPLGVDMEPEDG